MTDPPAYSFAQDFPPTPRREFCVDRHYLLYAAAGRLRLEADGQRWSLPPARAALIAADRPIEITLPGPVSVRSVLFAPDFTPPLPSTLTVFDMSPLARSLIAECAQWTQPDATLSPYATAMFHALALAVWRLADTPVATQMPVPRSPVVARALDLTEARLDNPPGFDALAAELARTPRTLARNFNDDLGMSWREALRRLRMIRAVEALADSDAPVTQIAFDVGYNSLSAFNAAFRAFTGQTPSEYRASFDPDTP